jgi:NarL family two-component system sensor histidine kinase LiaS
MKQIITFFQSLRGKLILTYTTVTVLALLALEIVILLTGFAIFHGIEVDKEGYLHDVISVLPSQARPYLQPALEEPDLAGLQTWLDDFYANGFASLPPQGMFDSPAAAIVKDEPMYVLSPDETVLAAAPAGAKSLVGRKYTPAEDVEGSQRILENALKLDNISNHLSTVRPDGNYQMAVPVRASPDEDSLAAVIIVTVEPPPDVVGNSWASVFWIVPITAFFLLMAVAPFGALFGLVMSGGITRRLKNLSRAADAWSEGDFSYQPHDRSKDEISYLGERLRRMAEHVQSLLRTRKELILLEERNRLARELHDTVKQETFATLMQVRAARNLLERDPAAARQHLEEAEELIKTSQQELGLMITELRPAAFEGQGLAGAMSDYLSTWSQHSRIPAEIQVQHERRLPLEVEQTLFRVAQEALSNVARHSRASAAVVRLTFDAKCVTLSISDNGIGFDPAVVINGFGLQSMRDRMTAIQGSFFIQAAPEGGTIVTASAPARLQEKNQS